jgi:ABC-2 type transport system permease protein
MLVEFAMAGRKVRATFLRDARLLTSYRLAFVFEWIAVVASVAGLWFVSKLVPPSAAFGGGRVATYFEYAVVNVSFVILQTTALQSFETAIRNEQVYGTLEAVLSTPTSVSLVVLAAGAWAFTLAFIQVAIYLAMGSLFGLRFDHLNIGSLAVFLILAITATVPLGVIGAASIVRFKQGAPTQFILGRASTVLAGVLFPISLLPFWLQAVSWTLPITHALNGIRGAFHGASLRDLSSDLIWLAVATIVLLPFSLFVFRAAVDRAKFDGTLGQY